MKKKNYFLRYFYVNRVFGTCCRGPLHVTALHSVEHGTAWFMGVGTVAETAVGCHSEDLGEVVSYLGPFKVDGAEGLDARGVDDRSATGQVKQLAESGRVHALVMGMAHVAHPDLCIRHQQVDD